MNDLEIEQDFLWVYCDSMSTIYLAKNQVYHVRTKHIDVKYHFVWDVLEDGDIEVKKIHTITPRSRNTYLNMYSDFSIIFFDLLFVFIFIL